MTSERTVYAAQELERLVNPTVVAVVGASEQPGSFGKATVDNLSRFAGRVYAVNPKHREIAGRPCVPSLRDLPETPDCIALCLARPLVGGALDDAIAVGAGGIVVYASGFAETGRAERKSAQEQLAAAAQGAGLRLVGPNCVGIANAHSGAAVNFMAGNGEMIHGRAGPIAIVSQSGALGYGLLQAMHRGVGVGYYLTAGNSSDVDVCDYIAWLAEQPATRSIVCLMEGVKSGRRFLEAARRAADAGKALIVCKAGNSEASGKAAFSHTGTLVGSAAAYRAAFDAVGAIATDNIESAMELAGLLAKARAPRRGRGIGIMATSGGAGVVNADKAEEAGLPLPPLAPQTRKILEAEVPDFGSIGNPCDTTAEVLKSPASFGRCLEAFAGDPGLGAVVVPLVFAHPASSGARAPTLCEVAASTDTLIAAVWMNEWLEGPGSAVLDADPNVVLFRSPQRCFQSLRAWLDWHERRDKPRSQVPATARRSPPDAAAAARAIVAACAGRTLSEQDSKRLLAGYGVATPPEALAANPDAAAEAAQRIGFPVAIKIASADIPHKTEVGGVRLDLGSPQAVREAAAAILASARQLRPDARIDGVSVQGMVPAGVELALGVRIDAQFGPLIVAGLGGVMIELLRDVATRIAPVRPDGALAMLQSLRGYPLLAGFRGRAGVNIDAAVDAICRVSELAADLADAIEEADINPLIVGATGAVAADALFVQAASHGA
jgi:acetate---CoA ligase (ADP-forming)